jgi:pimeloyl-CoA synthetase
MSMKKINVVELYVYKRIEKLEKENGKYDFNTKVIEELKDVLDVIHQTHFKPKGSVAVEEYKETACDHVYGR